MTIVVVGSGLAAACIVLDMVNTQVGPVVWVRSSAEVALPPQPALLLPEQPVGVRVLLDRLASYVAQLPNSPPLARYPLRIAAADDVEVPPLLQALQVEVGVLDVAQVASGVLAAIGERVVQHAVEADGWELRWNEEHVRVLGVRLGDTVLETDWCILADGPSFRSVWLSTTPISDPLYSGVQALLPDRSMQWSKRWAWRLRWPYEDRVAMNRANGAFGTLERTKISGVVPSMLDGYGVDLGAVGLITAVMNGSAGLLALPLVLSGVRALLSPRPSDAASDGESGGNGVSDDVL